MNSNSVVDPEFPRQGGANPKGGGKNLLFGHFFPENCMKMKEIRPGGGARIPGAPPLRSTTGNIE